MIGQIVAHYRILSEIGSGGMGSVYRALDEHSGHGVALKVLLREHASDPDVRSRFLHEARAQAMVSHPNVAAFYEVGEDAGQVYIAMEYITGTTLAEYVSQNEMRPIDALALVVKIGEGLQAAHTNGVIHRDLKPANIMLTIDGQPKITDFGLARFKGATTITKTGHVIGTACYMSPEQAEGRRVDHRSDLFSLGIILYELICRHVPFSGDNDTAVLYELLTRDPQPLSRYASNVPVELEQLIAKALTKNADERYQSAEEFVTDLNAVRKRLETGDAIGIRVALGSRRSWNRWTTYVALVVFAATAFLIGRALYQKQFLEREVLGLAVLPMSNIGAPDREYFTDGVSDELTTRLSAIAGLRVISRTSAMRYKDATKSIPEIARALKVDLIVEGTVRWDSSETGLRMRITPRLIRARDEQALWSETYDRSFAEVLLTQAEIAEAVTARIGEQLGQTLSLPRQTLPTTNVEAYNYYLRGSEYLNRGFERPDLDIAITQFSRAIELDSTFAAAYARLSRAQSKYYKFRQDPTAPRLEMARDAAQTALRLAPNLPEAHLALGYCLYWGHLDFDRAFDEFVQVRNLEPNNPDAPFAIGAIQRRRGHFDDALKHFEQSARLDPLSSDRVFEIGNTYFHMRRCNEADSFLVRAIALAPDQFTPYSRRILNYINCDADTRRARRVLDSSHAQFGAGRFAVLLYELDRLDGRYDSALARLTVGRLSPDFRYASAAKIYSLMGHGNLARSYYDSARTALESALLSNPNDADLLSDLGVAYAGLGRRDDALRAANRATALRPCEIDALGGPYYVERLAQVYVLLGEYDLAIQELERLLSLHNPVSKNLLRIDTDWSPLWNLPRFRALTG